MKKKEKAGSPWCWDEEESLGALTYPPLRMERRGEAGAGTQAA